MIKDSFPTPNMAGSHPPTSSCEIWNTGWNYDANLQYNRLDQTANIYGYLLFQQLQNAVGPSFIDPNTGNPTCGTPTAPIAG